MSLKLLLWLLVLAWVYHRWFGRKRQVPPPFFGAGARQPHAEPPKEAQATEDMVRCAHCGLFLPRPEALAGGGDWYCSEAHRQAGSGVR
ncbi:PP0621 family protein [Ferrovum sp.]|uniref:PP0621 family protein n=1 Tax=Ferrovum sp. TaxID=2609467 RepID=UPI00260FE8DA|nr:PP0621 family protein [Ferrovum sp.]